MSETKCVVAIVERGKADKIVDAAKKAGASGATIFYGRGTGDTEIQKFLQVNISSSKEVILVITEKDDSEAIIRAMVEKGNLFKPGKGILFTLPISNLMGLRHREEFKIE